MFLCLDFGAVAHPQTVAFGIMGYKPNRADGCAFFHESFQFRRSIVRVVNIAVNKYPAALAAFILKLYALHNPVRQLHALNDTFHTDQLTEIGFVIVSFLGSCVANDNFLASFQDSHIDGGQLFIPDIFADGAGDHHLVAATDVIVINREYIDAVAGVILDIDGVEESIPCFCRTICNRADHSEYLSVRSGAGLLDRAYDRLFFHHIQDILCNNAVGIAYLILGGYFEIGAKHRTGEEHAPFPDSLRGHGNNIALLHDGAFRIVGIGVT